MVTLDLIDSSIHSIEIKNAAGDALNIDASGFLTVKGNGDFNVTATDLDIRDLTFATDKVDASGSSVSISNTVTVQATDLDIRDLAFATDSVTAYQGGTWAFAIDAISNWKTTAESAGNTAAELVATPLSGRTKIEIQNLSNTDVYLGPANTVTTANGLRLPRGASYEMGLSDGVDIFAITAAGTGHDVRVIEYAA